MKSSRESATPHQNELRCVLLNGNCPARGVLTRDTLLRPDARSILSSVGATFQSDFDELTERNFDRSRRDLQAELASLRAELRVLRADLIKCMFLVWIGTIIPLGGLIVALHAGPE